jgi:hypothetical protein
MRRLRMTMTEILTRLNRAATTENPVVREILQGKVERMIAALPAAERRKVREVVTRSGDIKSK